MNNAGFTVLTFTVYIDAPPQAAFRVVADPRSKLVWVPAIRRVEMETGEPPGPGTRYLASSGVGPVEFVFHEQIREWMENRRVAYGGHSPWGQFNSVVELEPRDGGVVLHYRMDYIFPGGKIGAWIGRTLTRLFGRAMEARAAARLKEVVENDLWRPDAPTHPPMEEVVVTAYVDAPREQVFAAIGDPRKPFLTGNPITRMDVLSEQKTGVGTIYLWTFSLPFRIRFQFAEVVTEWVEPERFAYLAIAGWQMEAISALAAENGGTRITFTFRYCFPGLWRWLIPPWMVRLGLRLVFLNLRRLAIPKNKLSISRCFSRTSSLVDQWQRGYLFFWISLYSQRPTKQ